jgi:hypothetical protein
MTSGKRRSDAGYPRTLSHPDDRSRKLCRLWLNSALLPRLLRLHSVIGREETIFKPIELVNARPKLLKFRQPEFERPDY